MATSAPKIPQPLPFFDSKAHLKTTLAELSFDETVYSREDVAHTAQFLLAYDGSAATFNSYRREVERLLHWAALIQKKSLMALRRPDLEAYFSFLKNPPKSWIGLDKPPRFIAEAGRRRPNPAWRPFVATISKTAHRRGQTATVEDFELSPSAIQEAFAILSSFFNYLLQEEWVMLNPIALIRQKSKFIRRQQSRRPIRRLSELQWDYIIHLTHQDAASEPEKHERSLFLLSCFYAMYLRISELCASERWIPMMHHFERDGDGAWWFTTVGKGNKERQIAVSDDMLAALKRWRRYLGLTTLPSPADTEYLLPKTRGKGPVKSINYLRRLVQERFDRAIAQMHADGLAEEAEALHSATTHWLRHTGISEDVKTRPREHVREDAGHASSVTTDRYIDVELRARHASARKKRISENDDSPTI